MFQVGAAGWSILFRSASQAEANVLQPDVAEALKELAEEYLQMFRATLNLPNMQGRADKLLSEFRAGIKADVKASGAVLSPATYGYFLMHCGKRTSPIDYLID